MWSMSSGPSPAISRARREASNARSEEASPGPTMCRSEIPVRSRIHSSEVSTIFSRSAFVSRASGTCMPVPAMVAPRISRSGFTVGLDFLSDVLVHPLVDERDDRADRAADRAGAAAPMAHEAHAVDAEQGRRGVLLPVELPHQALECRAHQQGAEHRHRVARDLGADLL